ncbi:MAG TPA: DNA methyltransferase [Candidatus Glassbacteria bacterium]|nr:DNA methyltransferase [Candidatus Glassbacteria bacterium]
MMKKLIPRKKPKLILKKKAKGLNAEALAKSRAIKSEFLIELGTKRVPTSILIHDRSEVCLKGIDNSRKKRGGGYAFHYKKNNRKMYGSEDYTPGLEKSGLKLQGRTNTLSAFPQNIGRIITKIYCPEGGTVYDPFAGHNSRMELCYKAGMNYIGVDLCHEFMVDNKKMAQLLEKRNKESLLPKKNWIKLYEGSSAKVDLPDDFADFTITSPPYWDIEYYGPEEEQLGKAISYDDFIGDLYPHISENYRILKKGAFCCWFINDFRKKGIFYPYHIDLYKLFEEIGFIPFNTYIVDLGNPVNAAFVQDIIKNKILPKKHEYILVFKKE